MNRQRERPLDLTLAQAANVHFLRSIPCRKGHSRFDAFITRNARGYVWLDCRECHRERVRRQRDKIATQAKTVLFALAVVLAASTEYAPRDLVIEWQDGSADRVPATNQSTCNAAVAAIAHGWWTLDAGRAMVAIGCEPAAGEGPK